jgi:hypothetical protein
VFLIGLLFFIQVWDEMFANLSYFFGCRLAHGTKKVDKQGRCGHPDRGAGSPLRDLLGPRQSERFSWYFIIEHLHHQGKQEN